MWYLYIQASAIPGHAVFLPYGKGFPARSPAFQASCRRHRRPILLIYRFSVKYCSHSGCGRA